MPLQSTEQFESYTDRTRVILGTQLLLIDGVYSQHVLLHHNFECRCAYEIGIRKTLISASVATLINSTY